MSESFEIPDLTPAPAMPGLRVAVEAGVHSIEHGSYLDLDPDLATMMADRGTFYVPTFMVYVYHAGERGAPYMRERAAAMREHHVRSLQLAMEAGLLLFYCLQYYFYKLKEDLEMEWGQPELQVQGQLERWRHEADSRIRARGLGQRDTPDSRRDPRRAKRWRPSSSEAVSP